MNKILLLTIMIIIRVSYLRESIFQMQFVKLRSSKSEHMSTAQRFCSSVLYRVGMSLGFYRRLNPTDVVCFRETVAKDPDDLLSKVMKPRTMSMEYHAKLLNLISSLGYDSASYDMAVGPVVNKWGKIRPHMMLVVHYRPKSF